jgi:hypothetical protein
MPLPLFAIPLAISAIKALLKYRMRIDEILSIRESTAGLPFLLPDAPSDDQPHWTAVIEFFEADDGQAILLVKKMKTAFNQFKEAVEKGNNPDFQARKELYRLYCEACGLPVKKIGPPLDRPSASLDGGAGPEMLLAYYVVSSQRLSRNPVVTRIILATADTLIEIAGENAGLFISNPKTEAIIETLITEFAVRRDFDDDSSELILKSLLGSTIIAVAENPGKIADEPALKPLISAISDVRKDLGDDFVAKIISHEGFNKVVSSYLTHVAADPSFITNNDFFKSVLAQTLKELGDKLEDIQHDPGVVLGVLEVALTASATNVDGILKRQFENQPLLVSVLAAVVDELGRLGTNNELIKSVRSGALVPAIYNAALKAIEANPSVISDTLKTKALVGDLLSALAGSLADFSPGTSPPSELLEDVVVKSLDILGSQPDLLGKNQQFVNLVLQAVFRTGANVGQDGFSVDDLLFITQAALKTATQNTALIRIDNKFALIIESFGSVLAQEDIRNLISPKGLKDTFLAILGAVASNPTVWGILEQKGLVQPLAHAVLSAIASDPTQLLSGDRLNDSLRQILIIIARQGNQFINEKVKPEAIEEILKAALARTQKEIGTSIDGENMSDFLVKVLKSFLQSPFSEHEINKIEGLLTGTLCKMMIA